MELIKEIYESDFNPDKEGYSEISYKVRKASRAIIFDSNNNIALINARNDHHHKLPGGGIENGEDILDALKREVLEEAGCDIEVERELGITIEYKDEFGQLQISYSYICRLLGTPNLPNLSDKEKEAGFELDWVTLDEAIALLENDRPKNYFSKFMAKRDLAILMKAKEILY